LITFLYFYLLPLQDALRCVTSIVQMMVVKNMRRIVEEIQTFVVDIDLY